MAGEIVCLFNKFGHCKYQDRCRKRHVQSICERTQCEIAKCSERHPRECNYFKEFGRCKFGMYCSFKHKSSIRETCENLVKELDNVKAKLKALENEMRKKNDEIEAVLKMIDKKEEQTNEESDKENETVQNKETQEPEEPEEILKSETDNSSQKLINSKLETYCPECDILFRLEELLLFRNHCLVQHGWFHCKNSKEGEGCDFTSTLKTDLAEHIKDCEYV